MIPEFQRPAEVIHLKDGWEYWEGSPTYNEGTRAKSEVVCKTPEPPKIIRKNWHYLFKQSRSRYPWQFWMEIVAYRIGCVIGVDVPASHAAIGFDGSPGSLTEWMFDSGNPARGLELMGELMMRRDPEYDRNKGMLPGHCHNLEYLLPFIRGKSAESFIKMFTLDTLIANTDRHHDNWGFLAHTIATDGPHSIRELFPAPAFDNRTSLGHERLEEKLPSILADRGWLKRHATRSDARHHIRLHPEDEKGTPMLELVPELLRHFPDMLPIIRACATFSDEDIRDVIYPLCDFDMPVRLSENRAKFICRMVCERRDMLMERLNA